MFVSERMARKLITVRPDTLLSEVRDLMVQHNIRHLPVVDGEGLLVGIISDRDMRAALPSSLLGKEAYERALERVITHRAEEIMTANPLTVSVYYTIQDEVNHAFTSGTVLYDLTTNGVGLAPYHEMDTLIPQATKDYLTQLKTDIAGSAVNVDTRCAYQIMGDAGTSTVELRYTDGTLKTVTDANGHATTYSYDCPGRLLTLTDAAGFTETAGRRARRARLSARVRAQLCSSYRSEGSLYPAAPRLRWLYVAPTV